MDALLREATMIGCACLAGAVMALAAGWAHAEEAASGWQAGVARCDVTPKEPMWMAGYGGRDHPAEGTLHPLWVKALALKDAAGNRAVVVTSDVLGFPKAMSDRICARLKEQHQLAREQILLNSSHTHTGPILENSLYNIYPLDDAAKKQIEQYSRWLEDGVVECVGEALAALQPARLFSANGVARFAVNRRNNAEAEILDNHDLKGPVDHAVPVLKVAREDGSFAAVLFGYACHATVLSFYQWSGDYPGFAQIELETAHPGVTAMFFAGCGADQNPLPRRTVPLAQQYGRELAVAVDRVLADPMTALEPALKTAFAEIELAVAPPPSRDVWTKLANEGNYFQKRAAVRFLADLDQGKSIPPVYPYPVQVWRLGNQTIVALGGEVVVDYAVSLKRLCGRDLFVMAFSNDLIGYIPSVRVLREGGYEGDTSQMEYHLPGKWQEDVESRVLEGVRDVAAKIGVTVAAP